MTVQNCVDISLVVSRLIGTLSASRRETQTVEVRDATTVWKQYQGAIGSPVAITVLQSGAFLLDHAA